MSGTDTVPVGALAGAPGGDSPDAGPAAVKSAAEPLRFELLNGEVVFGAGAAVAERAAAAAIDASAPVAALAAGSCPEPAISDGRELEAREETPVWPGIESCCIKLGGSIAEETKFRRLIGGGEAIAEKCSCWFFGGPIALSGGVGSLTAVAAANEVSIDDCCASSYFQIQYIRLHVFTML